MSLVADRIEIVRGDRSVIRDLSLTVSPGELVAVVGPNGAGKSTLLKALAGLIAPRRGAVALDGRDLMAWDKHALGRAVAYLPQEGRVHWPLAVRTVVALGRLPHQGPFGAAAADREAVDAAMAATEVAALADRSVGALSGGERARVLLARALAQDARHLIADEPTAGLDPGHALAIFEHFRVQARAGRSIVVALHDLAAAARFCSRVVLLDNGRSIAVGTPGDVLTRDNLATAFGVSAHIEVVGGVPVLVTEGRIAASPK